MPLGIQDTPLATNQSTEDRPANDLQEGLRRMITHQVRSHLRRASDFLLSPEVDKECRQIMVFSSSERS